MANAILKVSGGTKCVETVIELDGLKPAGYEEGGKAELVITTMKGSNGAINTRALVQCRQLCGVVTWVFPSDFHMTLGTWHGARATEKKLFAYHNEVLSEQAASELCARARAHYVKGDNA
jgi:hypothetical protein